MENDLNEPDVRQDQQEDPEISDRREFLRSLGKWSTAAIAAILLSETLPSNDAAGWVNRRGSWVNDAGAGGRIARAHGPMVQELGSTAGQIGSTAAGRG